MTKLKQYTLVSDRGTVLTRKRMTPAELKRAVRRDRHSGQWTEQRKQKLSLLAKLFAAV